jgi:hypothetical protein
MYFCPECYYSFDITKSTKNNSINDLVDDIAISDTNTIASKSNESDSEEISVDSNVETEENEDDEENNEVQVSETNDTVSEINEDTELESNTESNTEPVKLLSSVDDIIKILKEGKVLSNYITNLSKDKILSNKKISKLTKEQKEKLNEYFKEDDEYNKIEFQCLNCNYRKPINNSIKLYEINFKENTISKFNSIATNKRLFSNPIYPRTKDYTCKNINCITHKDKTDKEAVFYKDQINYQLIYICGVCFTNWG